MNNVSGAIPADSSTPSTQNTKTSDNEPCFYCIYCGQKEVRLQGC